MRRSRATPRGAVPGLLALLLFGSFGFSVYQASRALQEAGGAQASLARAAATARDVQRLEVLSSDLGGWLAHYALDVSLGAPADASRNVYAQSFGSTLSELTALLGDLRRRPGLAERDRTLLQEIAGALTRLNVLDVQIRDAYARGTVSGVREGTALMRGEAFTTNQELAASASALSRRVVQAAQRAAQHSEQVARAGSQRLIAFTLGAAVLLLILGALAWEVIRRREQLVRHLGDLAARDGLTGIANRRRWDELLGEAARQARGSGQPLSIALLDLDHFKSFNDLYGHQAGDDQLRATAQYLVARLGALQGPGRLVVARYGGEEFGVLAAGLTPDALRGCLEDLRAEIPGGLGFSAGVAALTPDDSPPEAVRRADHALYCAKNSGRGRSVLDGDSHCPPRAVGSGPDGFMHAIQGNPTS